MRVPLKTGTLHTGQVYRVDYLTQMDLPLIMGLQDKVLASLEQRDRLQPLTIEEYRTVFSGDGFVLGVFVADKLIALRAMLEPPIDNEHLGYDAGLEEEDFKKVIYQEISCVDPAYQGNRLQQLMGRIAMGELDVNRFRYIFATVAPFNIPSLKDKLSLGLDIVALTEKYEGKLRYVFMKDMHFEKRAFKQAILLPMERIKEQQQLLKSNYKGVAIKEKDGNWLVEYAKP